MNKNTKIILAICSDWVIAFLVFFVIIFLILFFIIFPFLINDMLERLLYSLFISGIISAIITSLGTLGKIDEKLENSSEEQKIKLHKTKKKVLILFFLVFLSIGLFIFGSVSSIIMDYIDFGEGPEPPLPEHYPRNIEFYSISFNKEDVIEKDINPILISSTYNKDLVIEFKNVNSFSGVWSGQSPQFTIDAPETSEFNCGTLTDSWDDWLVSSREYKSVTPYLYIDSFSLSNYANQWVNCSASLSVLHPVSSGAFEYQNINDYKSRNINFYVVSPEDLDMVQEHERWADYNFGGQIFTIGCCASVVIIIPIIVIIWIFYKKD